MKQRNNIDQTTFEKIVNYDFYLANKPLCIELFRLTMNTLHQTNQVNYLNGSDTKYLLTMFGSLRLSVLELFYQNPQNNPDHHELVTRLLDTDLHSKNGYQFIEHFWLCVPLQPKYVLDHIAQKAICNPDWKSCSVSSFTVEKFSMNIYRLSQNT